MRDYHGYGKATRPLLPMIGIPTTAGTGSEAQTYALISDAQTHVKMACGDPRAAFRIALLDPALTVIATAEITATSGFDAIAHAVETFVTTSRNPLSEVFSREAWRLLERNYERVLAAARRSGSARRDAAGRLLRRHGDREFDAGRDACLRESADCALRHGARRVDRDAVAFGGALECVSGRRAICRAAETLRDRYDLDHLRKSRRSG